ncbi:alpha/beta fold hydrolase [Nocardia salmonicida]|uniref:alpha/beta hydrolase n=1 Tax=Nocardia salmonicida TaxID=53431 RepID=UPI0034048070
MSSNRILVEALAEVWPAVTDLVDGSSTELEDQVLVALHRLDAAETTHDGGDPDAAAGALIEVLKSEPRLHQEFRAAVLKLATTADRELLGARPAHRCMTFPLFVATDRAPQGGQSHRTTGDPLAWATTTSTVPETHRYAMAEKPRWWRLQFSRRSDRHVTLGPMDTLDPRSLTGTMSSLLGQAPSKAFVFVHGYNTSLEQAAARTAQLAYDLQFPGACVCYSWPSAASITKYAADEDEAALSARTFQDVLTQVTDAIGPGSVSVIAHSMGTRLVTDALERAGERGDIPNGWLDQIVLAAPDIDSRLLQRRAAAFHRLAARTTVYSSTADKALQVSGRIHGNDRAGADHQALGGLAGIDVIDATAARIDRTAHSYFGDSEEIVSDIFALLRHGHPPGERPRLFEKDGYWQLARGRI